MPKVSVIIPVYNSAAYLDECIGSVLRQTLEDIEVICVDDGSTDDSVSILRGFERDDGRVRVLEQANAGAGVARNLGMRHATGEYLSFLDSDDVFEPDMLEKLVAISDARQLDVAVCRCDKFDDVTGKTKPAEYTIDEELLPPKAAFAATEITERFFDAFVWWPWDKLYCRSFIEQTGLEYMGLRTTNDLFFVAASMLLASRIDYVGDILVHQRVHEGSLAKTREKSSDNFFLALKQLKQFLVERGMYDARERDFVNYCASLSIWQVESMSVSGQLELRRKLPAMFAELGVAGRQKGFFHDPKVYTKVKRLMEWPEVCVSVLMPSLNVGDYIEECMESVLEQSLVNIEVLCIDAGSTDGTLEVLRRYEGQDPRVRVIQSDMRSYGHQMNLGLRQARGDYIGIIETDDYAAPRMFERLYATAKARKAQVVKSDYYEYQTFPVKKDVARKRYDGMPFGRALTAKERVKLLKGGPCIWTGIYEREFLLGSGIDFLETPGASYQDTAFILKVWMAAERVVLMRNAFLHYRTDNEGSSVHSGDKAFYVCDEMDSAYAYMKERGLGGNGFCQALWARRADSYRWNYLRLADEWRVPFLRRMQEDFRAAERAGELQKSRFTPVLWDMVQTVLTDPEEYYRRFPGTADSSGERTRPIVSVVANVLGRADVAGLFLESLKRQSLEGASMLVIDDLSSPDVSRSVDEFMESAPNATLVREAGAAPGALLNRALDEADGEWLLFLDAGHVLNLGALEGIASHLVSSRADAALLRYDEYSAPAEKVLREKAGVDLSCLRGVRPVAAKGASKRILQVADSHVSAKAFRADFIAASAIRFSESHRCNYDVGFASLAMLLAGGIDVVPGCPANRVLTNKRYDRAAVERHPDEMLPPWIGLFEEAERRGLFAEYRETLLNAAADNLAAGLAGLNSPEAKLRLVDDLASPRCSKWGVTSQSEGFYLDEGTYRSMHGLQAAAETRQAARGPGGGDAAPEAKRLAAVGEVDVSVVVPAYNTGRYLGECLESICRQQGCSFEVVCVDDGSTDDSLDIAMEHAGRDPRITVLHQQNSGQSIARNNGVKAASGRYLLFVDSDDLIAEGALQALVRRADAQDLDILFFEAESFAERGVDERKTRGFAGSYLRQHEYSEAYAGPELMRLLRHRHEYWCSPCMLLVSSKLFRDEALWFYPGIVYEDNLFTFKALMSATRASCLHEALYLRRVRNGSTMTSRPRFRNPYGYFKNYLEMERWCAQRGLPAEDRDVALEVIEEMIENAVTVGAGVPHEEQLAYLGLPADEQHRFRLLVAERAHDRSAMMLEVKEKRKSNVKAARFENSLKNARAENKKLKGQMRKVTGSKGYRLGRKILASIKGVKGSARKKGR